MQGGRTPGTCAAEGLGRLRTKQQERKCHVSSVQKRQSLQETKTGRCGLGAFGGWPGPSARPSARGARPRWGAPGPCSGLRPNIPPAGGRVHMAGAPARPTCPQPPSGGRGSNPTRPPPRPFLHSIFPKSPLRGQRPPGGMARPRLPSHLPSPCSWSIVTVRVVTGDSPSAAGAPNNVFTTGCGVGGELQAKSRRRRCGGSGPSSMAAPGPPRGSRSLFSSAAPSPADTGLGPRAPAACAHGPNTNTTPPGERRRGQAGARHKHRWLPSQAARRAGRRTAATPGSNPNKLGGPTRSGPSRTLVFFLIPVARQGWQRSSPTLTRLPCRMCQPRWLSR